MFNIFDRQKRNEDVIDLLTETDVFAQAILEVKQKNWATRRRLISEIEEVKKRLAPEVKAAAERAAATARALEQAEKALSEAKAANNIAAIQSYGFSLQLDREIETRRRQLARSSDQRIQETVLWLEELMELTKNQLHFWTVYSRDLLGRERVKEQSSLDEVNSAMERLRALHKITLEMLYIDIEDPTPTLVKIKTDAEAAVKELNIDPLPKLEFDELSFRKSIPLVKLA